MRLFIYGLKVSTEWACLDSWTSISKHKKGERKKRQVDPIVKRWVWKIREREYNCCGQKLQYFLVKEHVVHLSVPKIYEILAEKYVLRSKWKKNKPRDPIPQAVKPRQVIQMATIH